MAKKRKLGPVQRQARRDVRAASRPLFNDLERQEREAKDIYEESLDSNSDIYHRTENMLGDLMPNWKDATGNIASDFTGQLSGLNSMLGISNPTTSEGMAGQQLLGAIGGGTLGTLAENQQRNTNYMQSSKRQALYDRNEMERGYLEDFTDIMNELKKTRFDLKGDIRSQVLARVDDLRERAFDKKMARREYQLRKSIAEKQEQRADRDSRTQRHAQNYATEQIQEADTKNDLRKLINKLENRKSDVKEDISELRDKYDIIQRNGKWGYMQMAGGEARFVELPEMKELVQKKRRIKTNVKKARKKRRGL